MSSHHTSGAHSSPKDQQSAHDEGFSTTSDSGSGGGATLVNPESRTEAPHYERIGDGSDLIPASDDDAVGITSQERNSARPNTGEDTLTRYRIAGSRFEENPGYQRINFHILQESDSPMAQRKPIPKEIFKRLIDEGTFKPLGLTDADGQPTRTRADKYFLSWGLSLTDGFKWNQDQAKKTDEIFAPYRKELRQAGVEVTGIEDLWDTTLAEDKVLGRFTLEKRDGMPIGLTHSVDRNLRGMPDHARRLYDLLTEMGVGPYVERSP